MDFDEWKDIFSNLFLNVDFPDEWTGVRFKSAWTKQNSGGLPNSMKDEVITRYAKNPQFKICPKQDCEVMFAMAQSGGRLPASDGSYHKYPFDYLYANVSVFKLEPDQTYLPKFNQKQAVYVSPVKRESQNAGRLKLKAG